MVGVHSWSSTVHGKTLISVTLNLCHTKTIEGRVTKIRSYLKHIVKNCMLIFWVSTVNRTAIIEVKPPQYENIVTILSIASKVFNAETRKINIQFLIIWLKSLYIFVTVPVMVFVWQMFKVAEISVSPWTVELHEWTPTYTTSWQQEITCGYLCVWM